MEKTVNERVLMLKTHLNLGRNEFSAKAGISPSTFDNIVNGNNLYPKTINAIAIAFNANKNWLISGKGKMFNEAPLPDAAGVTWKDEAYALMREQLAKKDALIEQLMSMLSKTGNFQVPLNGTGFDPIKALRVAA